MLLGGNFMPENRNRGDCATLSCEVINMNFRGSAKAGLLF